MATLTGGQALVQSLKREGIDTIFGLPGVQLDWAFDALYEEQDNVRVIHTRHEQATSYMADGYARATGKIGTNLVVPGPGLLNAMAGLSTAYACCSPVLCLTGQIQSDKIGVGTGLLHEIPHQLEMMAAVTKWARRAMHPSEIPGLVREAITELRSGRPRPVSLEIPPDILQMQAEVELLDPAQVERQSGDPELLKRAAELLVKAERPLIFVGSGIFTSEAWDELRALAEALQAPVVMSANGRGALSDRHPLALSGNEGRLMLPRADAILAVGTRFAEPLTRWGGLPEGVPTIQIDVDPEEVGRNGKPTIGIVSDAKLGLADLLANMDGAKGVGNRSSRADEVAAVKGFVEDQLFEIQPQAAYTAALRAEIPEDGILVGEMTQVSYFARNAYPTYGPRTQINPGYQGTLGCGFPIALGAQVGMPDRKVVSINGDGGFMFNVQELSTMKRHNIPLVAVVFSDGAFGNVKRIQQNQFGRRTIASDLLNPDFAKTAELFGIPGMRAKSPDEFQGVLREALATDGPVLIDVTVGEMPEPGLRMEAAAGKQWW
jgi:acetolactate synthase-1/2/3 large subunit